MKRTWDLSRRDFLRMCAIGTGGVAAWSVLGSRPFASAGPRPSTGPAVHSFSLDRGWLFGGEFDGSGLNRLSGDRTFGTVSLPHCVSELSWQNWNPESWEKVWIYRRHFKLPPGYRDGRVFLHFDAVMVGTTPVINGHALPQRLGGYLPSRYEITDWLKDSDNVLAVIVDSRWSNCPPEGSPEGPKRIDYLEPGGIIRSARLEVFPQTFISDVFAKPVKVLDSGRYIEVTCTIDAAEAASKPVRIEVELWDGKRVLSGTSRNLSVGKAGQIEAVIRLENLGNVKLWDFDAPHLYDVAAKLLIDEMPVHDYIVRTGIRDARFELDGFFLNGRRLQIFGLNRHELFPYVGFAMPRRVMRQDAEMLRHEFNCNMVRCSHYPQSEAFLDACDELGLMVWEEVPGWGYLGDEAWKELLVRDVREMVVRDRNHPSVIIWGVRVNESKNDPSLYRRTREIAKSLDDSRPTSGTMTSGSRKTWKTEWHQDVFAYDDYGASPEGGVGIRKPVEGAPYLITEAVGQFNYAHPKEGFNVTYRRAGNVPVQESQAIWHAQAHSRAAADPRICGVIAWCAFDYGSLINSYHHVKCPGVADVFRIPKLGASFYQSQISPEVKPVILPDFYWDFGPGDSRGPGKRSAVFSNCDRLEVFVDGKHHATLLPDAAAYPHLPHPPFFADMEIDGSVHPELRIDGYVDKRMVMSKTFSSDTSLDRFYVKADDSYIDGDGSDATRLVFLTMDKFGNLRPSRSGTVTMTLDGPGVIVGDNPLQLADNGGAGAVWIKARQDSAGVIKVVAGHSSLGSLSVSIHVNKVSPDPTLI